MDRAPRLTFTTLLTQGSLLEPAHGAAAPLYNAKRGMSPREETHASGCDCLCGAAPELLAALAQQEEAPKPDVDLTYLTEYLSRMNLQYDTKAEGSSANMIMEREQNDVYTSY